MLASWHSLTRLQQLTLVGLAFSAADTHHLHSFLAVGAAASLTSLVLGDQQGLNFLGDRALEGLGQLLGPQRKLKVLDLSGCIELTDQGVLLAAATAAPVAAVADGTAAFMLA